MGVQQVNRMSAVSANENEPIEAKFCMAIIWVQNGANEFDKSNLIETVKNMPGVFGAKFTREKPAILMVDYCTKETKAINLVEGINSLGAYARIVGC